MKRNKQKATIDRYFQKGDLTAIVGSKYSNIPRLEGLWVILEDMWNSIKSANQDVGYFKASIMTLFSMVAEYYTLQIDKDTRAIQKQTLGQARLEDCEAHMELIEKSITHYEDMAEEETKYIKKREYKEAVRVKKAELIEWKAKHRSIQATMELVNYDVTINGKVMYDMTTQLMGKAESIIKMLKEFNISPNKLKPITSIAGESPVTLTSQFKDLG